MLHLIQLHVHLYSSARVGPIMQMTMTTLADLCVCLMFSQQTENVEEASPAAVQQTNIQSYISWLNEYGSKNKLLIIPNESIHLEPNFPPL